MNDNAQNLAEIWARSRIEENCKNQIQEIQNSFRNTFEIYKRLLEKEKELHDVSAVLDRVRKELVIANNELETLRKKRRRKAKPVEPTWWLPWDGQLIEVPSWASWLAMDFYGYWFFYEEKPRIDVKNKDWIRYNHTSKFHPAKMQTVGKTADWQQQIYQITLHNAVLEDS